MKKNKPPTRKNKRGIMCDNYGLPLALIFEEILIDKPPKETEEEQEKEGTGGNGLAAPPSFCPPPPLGRL